MHPGITTSLAARPAAVYRWFDATGALLYVGISSNLAIRTDQHHLTKRWWPEIATCRVEWFPNRAEALEAESAAIAAENPRYNSQRPPRHRAAPGFSGGQDKVNTFMINARIPQALADSIDAFAVSDYRSRSHMVRILLTEAIEARQDPDRDQADEDDTYDPFDPGEPMREEDYL